MVVFHFPHPGFSSLDASRPWICYWILHSLALLGDSHFLERTSPSTNVIVDFLVSCQHHNGGFSGGPHQLPHLATSYAAVAALLTIGGDHALGCINREALYDFFLRRCVPSEQGGGMTMHEGGEVDVRGCYCAMACCRMLSMDTAELSRACSLRRYVAACQSAEGGIGGEPFNEAHGGYTFCGFAALALAGCADAIDIDRLRKWASRMQGTMEGGFMGRTCKLVDGCYSFWQGGLLALLENSLMDGRTPSNLAGVDALNSCDKKVFSIGEKMVDKKELELTLNEVLNDDAHKQLQDFVESLRVRSPKEAAVERVRKARARLVEIIDDMLQKEELYTKALEQNNVTNTDETLEMEEKHRAAIEAVERAQRAQESLATLEANAIRASFQAPRIVKALIESGEVTRIAAFPEGIKDSDREISVDEDLIQNDAVYDSLALQLWLLVCCQGAKGRGGLRDKPGKGADYYHTCYCLSGLSSSQYAAGLVLGGEQNLLARADPLCNVVAEKLKLADRYFGRFIT